MPLLWPLDAIQVSMTFERALPETDADASGLVEQLGHWAQLGVTHFVMDFGNPRNVEPIQRFVEQVITPMKRLAT
jgi:hypothetical protein